MKLGRGLQSTFRNIITTTTKKHSLQAQHSIRVVPYTTRNPTLSTTTTQRQRGLIELSLPTSKLHTSARFSHPSPPPSETMDTTESKPANTNEPQTDSQPTSTSSPLPALPPAESASSTLEVGGAALRLDHLGPLVVNEDGTMSRIANWDKMADIEKENTLRILGKRNQMRLAKLRAAKEAGNSANDSEKGTENK